MRLTVHGYSILYTSSLLNPDCIPWNEVRICSLKLDAKSEYVEQALLIQHDLRYEIFDKNCPFNNNKNF